MTYRKHVSDAGDDYGPALAALAESRYPLASVDGPDSPDYLCGIAVHNHESSAPVDTAWSVYLSGPADNTREGIGAGGGWAVVVEVAVDGTSTPGAMILDSAETGAIRAFVAAAHAETWAGVLAAMRAAGAESTHLSGTPGL